jgi:putative flavoprotein involved in K+ transport
MLRNAKGGKAMIDCVVVGAGPAGLAASTALTERDVEHVVLERGRVVETWRTQRWDSFRLVSPGWKNAMLGEQPPDAYAPAAEVVDRLEKLAARCPVREGVGVARLTPDAKGWYVLATDDGEVRARTVVVASGHENVPHTPSVARAFPERITQYHAADYRCPAGLPDGVVLVVGSAQAGCQITDELLAAGRQIVLATSPVGRVPTPYRGRDTVEWLYEAGFFHQRPADLPDPAMMRARQPILGPGRGLSLQALARAGATLTGRLVAVDDQRVHFDDSAGANVAAGDAFAARVGAMVDEAIERTGRRAPPAEPDPAVGTPVDLDTTTLDLGELGAVVWCTGFSGDFSWLGPTLVDPHGQPTHIGCAAGVPGVWYVGLRWLTHRGSATLDGFPTDAATVADGVRAQLDGSDPRRTRTTSRRG